MHDKIEYMPLPPHNYDQAIHVYKKGFSQKVYKYLSEDTFILYNKYLKWTNEIGDTFCEDVVKFGQLHKDIYKVTNVPKYRSFQYRLLQRALVTNINLFTWGMIPNDLCTFCSDSRETITHLLWDCIVIKQLWKDVIDYICTRFHPKKLKVDVIAILQNSLVPRTDHVINFICLITKQYIYRQKCMKKPISMYELKANIARIESIEKYIAIKNGRLQQHNRKWSSADMESHNLNHFVLEYVQTM